MEQNLKLPSGKLENVDSDAACSFETCEIMTELELSRIL